MSDGKVTLPLAMAELVLQSLERAEYHKNDDRVVSGMAKIALAREIEHAKKSDKSKLQ